MYDDTAYPPKTSLREWPRRAPQLDTKATDYTVFALGLPRDDSVIEAWCEQLRSMSIVHDVVDVPRSKLNSWTDTTRIGSSGDESCMDTLRRLAATKFVGWRVAAAGPEIAILALISAARRVGLITSEVAVWVTDTSGIRVYCPHCKSCTATFDVPGTTTVCSGCGGILDIRPHVSLESGMYLGIWLRGPIDDE